MEQMYRAKSVLFYKIPDFPKEGVNFIDITPTCRIGVSLFKTTVTLTGLIAQYVEENSNGKLDFDYVICPDARGFLWGMSVALNTASPLIPVRKHGKLPKESIMDTINYETEYSTTSLDLPNIEIIKGMKFLFVDDVFATGGTYEACKQLVERNGGIMLEPAVILDLKMSNYKVHSLITIDDIDNAKEFNLKDIATPEEIKKYDL